MGISSQALPKFAGRFIFTALAGTVGICHAGDNEMRPAQTRPVAAVQEQQNLSKPAIKAISKGVFEVVVPKPQDANVEYEKPLNWDKVPFAERNDKYLSVGTAFAIGPNRFISASHVFKFTQPTLLGSPSIRSTTGSIYKITKITRYSESRDIIEFEVQSPPPGMVVLPLSANAEVGDTVYSVGNAQGEGISFRSGQISSFTPEPVNGRWNNIRFSAPASPGNSGGPLINAKGQVVGVILRKNATENLNFAYQAKELRNIPSDKADFLEVMKMSGEGKTISHDWQVQTALPSNMENLGAIGQQALGKAYDQVFTEVSKMVSLNTRPHFYEFIRAQNITGGAVSMLSLNDLQGTSFSLKPIPMKSLVIEGDGALALGQAKSITWMEIQRPSSKSERFLYEHPEYVLNQILKLGYLRRRIGDEEVKVTSLGRPLHARRFKDALGRPWTSYNWDVHFADVRLINNCMATPEGMLCQLTTLSYSYTNKGSEAALRQQADFIMPTYRGTVAQWWEYLGLGADFVSPTFKNMKMAVTDGKRLFLSIGPAELNLLDGKLSKASQLLVMTEFAPDSKLGEPLAESLQMVDLYPSLQEPFDLQIKLVHSPLTRSPASVQTAWKDLPKYTQKTPKVEGTHLFTRTFKRPPAGEEAMAIITCYTSPTDNKSAFGSRCSRLSSGTKIHP